MHGFLARGAIALTVSVGVQLFAAATAQACSPRALSGANAVIPAGAHIDQGLVDAAIRAEINYHRCRANLRPVSESTSLRKVAARHAEWMAKSRTLSHRSTTPGQTTTLARIKASGLRIRAGSENIGYLARYRIDNRSFRISSGVNCGFSGTDGTPIPPHSYASLARSIVQLWMESPVHRRNILDRKVSRAGSGIGFDPKAPHCGNFYVSQDFAG